MMPKTFLQYYAIVSDCGLENESDDDKDEMIYIKQAGFGMDQYNGQSFKP